MALVRIFHGHAVFDMMHLQQMRDVIKKSRELLASSPVPSTFAGRKTQEPFRSADDDLIEWRDSERKPPLKSE